MPVSTFLPRAPAAGQPRLVPADERLIHLYRPGQPVPAPAGPAPTAAGCSIAHAVG